MFKPYPRKPPRCCGGLLIVISLFWLGRAAAQADPTFNAKAQELKIHHKALLFNHQYQIQQDGSVWAPDGGSPLRLSEVKSLLRSLESRQRLKALLQMKLVLSRSDGEKYLTPAERGDIRRIARENWPYFTMGTRKDFRSYFTVQELEEMNRDPAPILEELEVDMKDPEPAELPEPEPPRPAGLFPKVLQPLRLQTPQAPAPAVTAAPPAAPPLIQAPAAAPTRPTPPAPQAPAALPSPSPVEALPKPTPPPASTPSGSELGVLKSWTPPAPAPSPVLPRSMTPTLAFPAATEAGASIPPPTPLPGAPGAAGLLLAPPTRDALPGPPPPIAHAEFEKFLMDAPYGRDAKSLLRLISEKAPDFARSRALNAVLSNLPHIVFDSDRAGSSTRAALLPQTAPSGEKSYVIALSPGPVILTRKRMFFGSRIFLLPDSPGFYAALRLPAPPLEASKRDSIALRQEPGDWGLTRVYADQSRRGAFSHQQQAGSLLRLLLLLDAERQGWGASAYAAQLYSLTAQRLFYARLEVELQDDAFLDIEARLSYRHWIEDPAESRDDLVHSLAAGRLGVLDPRKGGPEGQARFNREALSNCLYAWGQEKQRDISAALQARQKEALALREAGLIDDKQLEASQKAAAAESSARRPQDFDPYQCGRPWQEELPGLKLASLLLSEMTLAEQRFRQERGAHAEEK